ncbi:MAG: sulfotransferase [Micropepsaceae bacterium]
MSRVESTHSLKEQAVAKAGLDDFGDRWFERPLAAWAEDLQGPLLSERGRGFMTRLAVANLVRRLELIECFKRNPSIGDVVIPSIVYITGLERSGTTLLHNLLALHPRSRTLLRWELMRATPPPDAATYRSDARIAEVQASIEPLRGTMLEQMHWVNADEPEECTWGAYDCTGLLGQAAGTLMPTWARFLRESDMSPSYREYRRLIKLLTWRNPVEGGGHLVLKCPQNSRHIKELAGVLPEARFVFTHRDPFRTTVSVCALADHISSSFTARPDLFQPGGSSIANIITSAELGLGCMISFDSGSSDRVVNVAYPALVREPSTIVRGVYQRFDMACPGDLDVRIGGFVAAQAGGKRKAPPRELPSYGLESGAFRARPAVAAYCDRFGVQAEINRITGG